MGVIGKRNAPPNTFYEPELSATPQDIYKERLKEYKNGERKKRKQWTKSERLKVYEKCNGHCAYCGCELEYKDMQIDHIVAIHGGDEADKMIKDKTINTIDNCLPSCRQCNFYKEALTIEEYRNKIQQTLTHTCVSTFPVKLALKYGILKLFGWDGKFYFEKMK